MGASNPIFDLDRLNDVVDEFCEFDEFVFDVETMGQWRLDPRRNVAFWMVLAGPGARTEVIPFGHPKGEKTGEIMLVPKLGKDGTTRNYKTPVFHPPPKQLAVQDVMSTLKRLFFSSARKIGHNVKFDVETCAKYWGELPPGPFGDTEIVDHLLDENHHEYKLGKVLDRQLHVTYDKSLGAELEKEAFSVASRYCHYDGRWEWLLWQRCSPWLEEDGLGGQRDLNFDALEAVMAMEMAGIPLDVLAAQKLDRELDREIVEARREMFDIAGHEFNMQSTPQMQKIFYGPKSEGGRGLRPTMRTKGGAPSVAEEALKAHEGDELVDAYVAYGDIYKVSSTYVKPYLGTNEVKTKNKNRNNAPALADDGRIHPNFRFSRTVTGRFSCVSGNTLLTTSRGTFRFDEYMPQAGDLVPTHQGRWMPVRRKLYKGLDEMYRVCLTNGEVLDCTAEHRVMTPYGWEYIGALRPGSEVLSYVDFPVFYEGQRQGGRGGRRLPVGVQTYDQGVGIGFRDVLQHGAACGIYVVDSRAVQGREGTAVLTVQSGQQESDERKEWFPTPQLHRGYHRQGWASSEEDCWQVCFGASDGSGASTGSRPVARLGHSASHRREQAQQLAGQLGVSNTSRARLVTSRCEVTQIIPLGRMGVWDIEVEGDHSYLTQGFISHNCTEPNLQNIPRPDTELGKQIRSLFIAPPGYKFIVADYKQIEYVVMAHFSGDPTLIRFFEEGRDFHLAVASMILGIPEADVTKVQRTVSKNANFAVAYGAGIAKLAQMSGITEKEARAFSDAHRRMLPALYQFNNDVIRTCRKRKPVPYVKTLLGRKRRLPAINWSNDELRMYAERQAVNTVVQGTAADVNKVALVRLHEMRTEWLQTLLTVHDEFVISVPDDRVDEGLAIVNEAMVGEGIQELMSVPLGIDIQAVQRWSDAKS